MLKCILLVLALPYIMLLKHKRPGYKFTSVLTMRQQQLVVITSIGVSLDKKHFLTFLTITFTALPNKMMPIDSLENATTCQYKLSCVSFEKCV